MAVAEIRYQSRRLSNRHYPEAAERRAEIRQRQLLELVGSRKGAFNQRLLRRRDLITPHLETGKARPSAGLSFGTMLRIGANRARSRKSRKAGWISSPLRSSPTVNNLAQTA